MRETEVEYKTYLLVRDTFPKSEALKEFSDNINYDYYLKLLVSYKATLDENEREFECPDIYEVASELDSLLYTDREAEFIEDVGDDFWLLSDDERVEIKDQWIEDVESSEMEYLLQEISSTMKDTGLMFHNGDIAEITNDPQTKLFDWNEVDIYDTRAN